MKPERTMVAALALLASLLPGAGALAQPADLDLKFSCSASHGEGEARVILADTGEIHIHDGKLLEFRWESALHRRTHGFDCSIDQSDKLELQPLEHGWRVAPTDAAAARSARGFDRERGRTCLVNLLRDGDTLHIQPSCPTLCGSRADFSEFRVHLPSSRCDYVNTTE